MLSPRFYVMGNLKEVCGVWALVSRFLAQVCLYVDIRLITSPCTAHAICVWQDLNYKLYFNWKLINYLCRNRQKRNNIYRNSIEKKFVNIGFEKNILLESKTTIISVQSNGKRWNILSCFFYLSCVYQNIIFRTQRFLKV